uniref:Hyperpolarization activated cyclic nucleotide-gated potassium channel 4 n=1 Tax=Tetraselmis sp. GSL018 TaxID=582737 RepID=A0A061S2C0_9CHLO|mmetsp:Transcript_695/g.1661  ORF Transcript_695/g.1661 Transcript_695/m.1661 type:complete len:700 (-) Transcript_695:259-2358(-)
MPRVGPAPDSQPLLFENEGDKQGDPRSLEQQQSTEAAAATTSVPQPEHGTEAPASTELRSWPEPKPNRMKLPSLQKELSSMSRQSNGSLGDEEPDANSPSEERRWMAVEKAVYLERKNSLDVGGSRKAHEEEGSEERPRSPNKDRSSWSKVREKRSFLRHLATTAAEPDATLHHHPVMNIEPEREDEAPRGRCDVPVIHPLSKLRHYWDLLIIAMVMYTTLVLPVRTAFLWHEETGIVEEDTSGRTAIRADVTGWTVMEIIIDFTFLLDVALNFNTGFIREPDYVAVMDRRQIAAAYLRGWFMLDLLSSIPLDLIIMQQSNTALRFPRVLRLIRTFRLIKVLRLSRAFRYAERLQIFSGMSTFGMRITKLIFLGVIFLHWNACTQFLVAAASEFPEESWVVQMELEQSDMFTQYSWAMFLAGSQMFCIGYGPVMPYLVQEAWTILLSFVLGASLFAVFVGIITSMLISADTISSTFYQKMEVVNQYMAHRKLPLGLRHRIRDSMEYKWRTRRALDEHLILQDFPSGLRSEAAAYVCRPLILKVPFFRDADEGFVQSLALYLHPEVFIAGEAIVKEGMLAREMYFLNTGLVKITAKGIEIVTISEGSYFGEIGVLHSAPRSATCTAVTDCEVFVLYKSSLEEVMSDFPQYREHFLQIAEQRLREVQVKSSFTSGHMAAIPEENGEEGSASAAAEPEEGRK